MIKIRNSSLLRLTTRPHAKQFEKWNLIHCRNRYSSLCCNVPSSILFNSICCTSCGTVFPNQGSTENCWGIHDNSWNKIITILNYCKKFRMSLERSQEFFSVDWQARSNLHVLPIVSLKSGLFWAITQSVVVISSQRFGITYWSNLQRPRNQIHKILEEIPR